MVHIHTTLTTSYHKILHFYGVVKSWWLLLVPHSQNSNRDHHGKLMVVQSDLPPVAYKQPCQKRDKLRVSRCKISTINNMKIRDLWQMQKMTLIALKFLSIKDPWQNPNFELALLVRGIASQQITVFAALLFFATGFQCLFVLRGAIHVVLLWLSVPGWSLSCSWPAQMKHRL